MSDTMDIGGSVEGTAPGSGSGIGNNGIGTSQGGLDTSGISAVDLSGSSPGPNGGTALSSLGQTIAALFSLGYTGSIASAPTALISAANGIVALENQAQTAVAYSLSSNPDVAQQQLTAFTAGSQ